MPTTDKNRNGRHSHPQKDKGGKSQGDPTKDALKNGDKDAKQAAPKKQASGSSDEAE